MKSSYQELNQTTIEDWDRSDNYHNSFLLKKDEGLDQALAYSESRGLPDIAVSAAQGKLLELFARTVEARRILEVGTLGGYSTICMARALPADGELISLELKEEHALVARHNVMAAGLTESLVKIIVGPAAENLLTIHADPPFDLAFIDADKENNVHYFQQAERLVRKGGIIVVDNVVRNGRVSDTLIADSDDGGVKGVRNLLKYLAGNSQIEATTIATVGDKGYDGFIYAIRL